MELAGYLSLFLVGLSLGALGSGGSVLSVPILVYLFSLDAVAASGYSLFVVGCSSVVGAFLKYKEQQLSLRVALLFGIPSIISIFCSRRWLLPLVPEAIYSTPSFQLRKESLLLVLFGVLMVVAAAMMLTNKNARLPGAAKTSSNQVYLPALGVLTGCMSGFVGIGGGFLIIPVLVTLASLPLNMAIGTALVIVAGNSFIGFTGDVFNYSIDWLFVLKICGLSMVGLFAGVRFTGSVPSDILRRLFAWLILLVGCAILIRELYWIAIFGWRFSVSFNPAGW